MDVERWLLCARLRLRSLFHGSQLDRDVDDELRDHVERQIAQLVAEGMTPAAARTAALRALGGVTQQEERLREVRGVTPIVNLLRDLRVATRMLVRRPAFAVTAIVTIAIGIGASTAIFAVVNGVLLQPLPFPEPDRLLQMSSAPVEHLFGLTPGLGEPSFLDVQRGTRLFDSVAMFGTQASNLTGAGEPARVTRAEVTTRFFDVLRAGATLGRVLTNADAASPVVVIGERLWRTQFAAAPDVIGRSVRLDGVPHLIVGVMPAGFSFPDKAECWTPLAVSSSQGGNSFFRPVIGRLKPGATAAQARAELESLTKPANATSDNWLTIASPLKDRIVGDVERPLAVLAATVAFVLLIACANVSNLFLVRTAERERELTLRAALGAGRGRLIQQLVAESLAIAIPGALLGIALAYVAMPALIALAPAGAIPRVELIRIDFTVLGVAALLALLSALAFGLLPALRAARRSQALVSSTRTVTLHSERLHAAFVVVEIALAVILLTGAGLMLKSFLRLRTVDTGFNATNVVTATIDLPETSYRTTADAERFHHDALAAIAALPDVESAGVVNWLPFGMMSLRGDFALEGGRTLPPGYLVIKPAVSADYFRAMGIRLLDGRAFTDRDDDRAQPVAIVTASVARELWPGERAIGQRLSLQTPPRSAGDWLTVVGVVDDIRQGGLMEDRSRAIYQPYQQVQSSFFVSHVTFVVRTAADPARLLPGLRDTFRRIDPDMPVPTLVPMSQLVSAQTASPAFQARLLSIFAVAALALTIVGIYGVMAYAVTRRTREFGIRLALGSSSRDVVRLVVVKAAVLALIGVAIGVAGAFALTRVLGQLLFEVTPTDPPTFITVVVLLAAAALTAAAIPAWRAAHVDPVVALRAE
ncbi:MAG TPA: ABC transporter permease [Vicinamibacterales bacterium]|nr:ABC transporter permease [Vicinamibacterales bacterium]